MLLISFDNVWHGMFPLLDCILCSVLRCILYLCILLVFLISQFFTGIVHTNAVNRAFAQILVESGAKVDLHTEPFLAFYDIFVKVGKRIEYLCGAFGVVCNTDFRFSIPHTLPNMHPLFVTSYSLHLTTNNTSMHLVTFEIS